MAVLENEQRPTAHQEACAVTVLTNARASLRSLQTKVGTKHFRPPFCGQRNSLCDCSKRVQMAVAVIRAVEFNGFLLLKTGATETSQAGSPSQDSLFFKVQSSRKSNNFACSLGTSNLGRVAMFRTELFRWWICSVGSQLYSHNACCECQGQFANLL